MNCKRCHQDYDENLNACPYCGAPKEQPAEGYQPPVQQPQYQQAPPQQPQQPQPGQQPVPPVPPQAPPQYQQVPPQQPQQGQQQQYGQPQYQPQYQQVPPQYVPATDVQAKAKNMATASMICGILGLILCWTPYAGLILNILGIVFYTLYKKNEPAGQNGMATAGLVCSIIGLIVSIIFTILWTTVFAAASFYASNPWMWSDLIY
ncbi:hypothetical protein CE91St36_01970 [Christensenellaceae bacterium]|nr:hypothetical protein CE91St36_01970 [Christensenellaceae bacterium]BDF60048.1 hypothetical protein CE91St37_01980 [Christensenellaceae bacterium]